MKILLNRRNVQIAMARYISETYDVKAKASEIHSGNMYGEDFISWEEPETEEPEAVTDPREWA